MINEISTLKNKINELYNISLIDMENGSSVNEVRDSFIKIATYLNDLSNISLVDKPKAINQARMMLGYAKKMREESSYKNVYLALTGKHLKEKEVEPVKKIEMEEEVGYQFEWNTVTDINFSDVAGLEEVKEELNNKVLLPFLHPELFQGYEATNGGGLLLYGPPGTGKTMIAAAIANEMKAKFVYISPSSLLTTGVGNTEKLIKQLFTEGHSFQKAIIYFDELESLCPKTTRSQIGRQIRSELLTQMQGLKSYEKKDDKILYLIASTNKPWEVDPAFIRPGRFGTRVYVGLPDEGAREYIITHTLEKIKEKGLVDVQEIDIPYLVELTNGYSGADIKYLLDKVQDISIKRALSTNEKIIIQDDFIEALNKVTSSIQKDDIAKLNEWKIENNA